MTASQSGKPSHRILYLDFLRVLCSLMIIGVHISALNWEDVAVTSTQWQAMNLYDCISILGVPLFFMISGAVFLKTDHSITIKELYFKKILRLFVIYHIWLLFYNSLPFFKGELPLDFVTIKDELFLKTLLGKGIYHLWFLPQLIVLYMISPLLKEAFQKKSLCIYYLIIFTITGAILPTSFAYDYPYRTIVQSYYDRASLVMLTGYIGYFILGHYLHSHVTKPLSKKALWGLALAAAICMTIVILACRNDAIAKASPSTIINNPLMFPQWIACSCIYLILKNCFQNIQQPSLLRITNLSKYTMGIYLIHPFIIRILAYFGISTLMIHPIIMIPLLSFLVFLICLGIIYILSFIPIVKKWLI